MVIYGEDLTQQEPEKQGWIARFLRNKTMSAPGHSERILKPAPESAFLDLDKSWGAIHFAFTDSNGKEDLPAGFILNGAEIGEIDVGYGPARGFGVRDVFEIHQFLSLKTAGEWVDSINPAALLEADVYPFFDEAFGEDEKNYVSEYLAELKSFVADIHAEGDAMIVYLN